MRILIPLAALLVLATPTILPAQASVSLQAGAVTGADANAFEFGLRLSSARPNSVGIAFSFDAVPQLLSEGAFVGLTDLSLAGNLALASAVRLELRAGGSALIGIGGGGAGALGGYHVGAGMVFDLNSPVGMRVDYTYRRLAVDGETYPLPSLTIGLVLHH